MLRTRLIYSRWDFTDGHMQPRLSQWKGLKMHGIGFDTGNKEGEWYMEHLLSWYPHRNDSNVMFVVYEDLVKNHKKEIKRIADFLGVAFFDQDVSSIAEATSFASMSKNSNPTEDVLKVYRTGKVGDWKNYFTVAQSEKMDALVKEKLADTDIKFIYEL
ncbi:sulfotransferase 6B1-like [Ciona intestinalis]